MDNQELRRMKEQLGLIDFKIGYKTGVHYGVIEDFFSGKTDELAPKDRQKIEALFEAEAKKR
ncbi:MAG: hypothetical protein E7474_14610 [Ruminococcaceae bacterium]|jgi:predicted transcriptional regulator|nr:hypothetical protein [Oscillospiraceae bacterium]